MNKIAIVTGASQGIGRGIALKLAKEGYDIAFSFFSATQSAEELCAEIQSTTAQRCAMYCVDMRKDGAGAKFVNQVSEEMGVPCVLVNNAGRTRMESILDITPETVDELINLDLKNYLFCMQAAATQMVRAKISGSIINITSTRAERAYPCDAVYGGVKAALNRASQSAALDLAPYGIERFEMKGKFVASARHLGRSIWKNRACYSLMLPGIIWFILFAYGPMSGLLLAFKTYSARGGIWGSPWCGFENFAYVFKDAAFFRSVWTTLTINVGRLLFQFPVPIILALLINECKWKRFNKIAQTIFTFPYFLSWVIVASIVTNVLSLDGMVNSLLAMLNLDKTNFLGNSTLFIPLLYLTDSWKSAGWSAIIYLAALSGIDVDQYEAAELDGANRWQTLIRVTLPNLKPTILVMLVLSIGNLMTGGFDQIFNLSNPAVEDICEILDMYIYRITFGSVPDFGFSMAISLFRSVVNCIFLIAADRGAKKFGGSGLFG